MDDGKVKEDPARSPVTEEEKKLIAQGKATLIDGKVVESNLGKVEGRK